MHPYWAWLRFTAVAVAYGAAFALFRRTMPFSLDSPWFVLVAMICFLGLAFVAQPLLMMRMPRPLRALRAWEVEGRLYRTLGVHAFGSLLRRTPLRLFNRDVYLRKGVQETARVLAELEAAEASHFWAAVLVLPYMIHAARAGAWDALLEISLAQLAINVYPIMHLRLSRHRVVRLCQRRSIQRAATSTSLPPSS
jgi:hypothetical protein